MFVFYGPYDHKTLKNQRTSFRASHNRLVYSRQTNHEADNKEKIFVFVKSFDLRKIEGGLAGIAFSL